MKKLVLILTCAFVIVSCERDELDDSLTTSNSVATVSSSCNLILEDPFTSPESTFFDTTCNNPVFNTCFGVRMARSLRTEFNRRRSQLGQFAFREILNRETVSSGEVTFFPISDLDGIDTGIDIFSEMPVDIANILYRETACDIDATYDALPGFISTNQAYFLRIDYVGLDFTFDGPETENTIYTVYYTVEKITYGN
ncbi:hypothetical protein [uncultured Dokdonia sp.]|uniref:hypothetical protein n=1 Tax=uncultured Dokdonia sp. TaxID=575653 RepID=UPI002624DEEF|nr:hypothetical protein [uncultured Dokdonia sp.]